MSAVNHRTPLQMKLNCKITFYYTLSISPEALNHHHELARSNVIKTEKKKQLRRKLLRFEWRILYRHQI